MFLIKWGFVVGNSQDMTGLDLELGGSTPLSPQFKLLAPKDWTV